MSYTQGDTIKDMTIYESKNITIKDIYNKIKSNEARKAKLPTILFQDKKISIALSEKNYYYYIIDKRDKINNKNEIIQLLKNPISLYKDDESNEQKFDIINKEQYQRICLKFSDKELFCESKQIKYLFSNSFFGEILKSYFM